MPVRPYPLATGEIYHIVNRGVAGAQIFTTKHSYRRFVHCLNYYRFPEPPVKLSYFLKQPQTERITTLESLARSQTQLIEVFAYCLMPNHFHLLVRQLVDGGISRFMSQVCNSYSRFFNTRFERFGPLLQGVFKSIRIATDEQFLHTGRYIHINPYVGFVVTKSQLESYQWSSLPTYLGMQSEVFVDAKPVLSHFNSVEAYRNFLYDEADYKRKQKEMSFLMLE